VRSILASVHTSGGKRCCSPSDGKWQNGERPGRQKCSPCPTIMRLGVANGADDGALTILPATVLNAGEFHARQSARHRSDLKVGFDGFLPLSRRQLLKGAVSLKWVTRSGAGNAKPMLRFSRLACADHLSGLAPIWAKGEAASGRGTFWCTMASGPSKGQEDGSRQSPVSLSVTIISF